jgi:hypothetical protein
MIERGELALGLLALCLVSRVAPGDLRGITVGLSLLALPLASRLGPRFPQVPVQRLGALLVAVALCSLALQAPAIWLQTGLATLLVVSAGLRLRALEGNAAGLALGLGVLAPAVAGGLFAAVSAIARRLLLGELGDWSVDFGSGLRFAQWLAAAVAICCVWRPSGALRGAGWLAMTLLVALLIMRVSWLATTISVQTDAMIWSEPPLLLNLLKLRAGEVFYGPMTRLNTYSYSPTLEHLQYALLRPVGLELSLRAHRALGIIWQVLATSCWLGALKPWLKAPRSVWLALWLAALGLTFSSLLAPHLHPDHLLMLCLSAGFWLVTRDGRPSRLEVLLLVTVPVAATMVKLTGAGVGLGLGLAYAWERDWRRLAWLAPAGALALSTIWIFDATLGHFSDYAIWLQASHPWDIDRALSIWKTAPVLLFSSALLACGWRWREARDAPATRCAMRAALLTCGIGLTSLAAYAKHGGRDNSLLPLTLGGALVLLLALCEERQRADPARHAAAPLLATLSATLALILPLSAPLVGEPRARLDAMHETATAWLARSARAKQRVFTSSTAAYLSAGLRAVPDASLATISELALAGRPEVGIFERDVRERRYDGLLLSASALRQNPTIERLLSSLQRDYRIVAPPERRGSWPRGAAGYVIVERRAAFSSGAPAVR